MRLGSFVLAMLLTASAGGPSFAFYCESGQQPVPHALAARLALPACGFAAIQSWGPNGCQLCDSGNMHPDPFAGYDRPGRRTHHRQR